MQAFLSLPITTNLGEDGRFRPDRRQFYSGIIDTLTAHGISVVSAALNEDWGRIQLSVEEFTRFDCKQILSSELLVVCSSEGLSRDIYLEIGLAVGKGIPVFLFASQNTRQTYMLQGLQRMDRVSIHFYSQEKQASQLVGQIVTGWLAAVAETEIS